MKTPVSLATLAGLATIAIGPSPVLAQDTSLNVFLMAGQSNMEGHAYAHEEVPWNIPTLEYLIDTPAYLAQLPDATYTFKPDFSADWADPRSDVWAVQYDSIGGSMRQVEPTPSTDQGAWATAIMPLSPGFGSSNAYSSFGPELGMGTYLGDNVGAPLLLVKCDHGGRTLAVDFRPPSAGGTTGGDYLDMIASYQEILDGLDDDLADDGVLNNSIAHPDHPAGGYDNATGYHLAAFVWLQGWNEMGNAGYVAEYEDNLVHLIHDLRASDSRIPGDLPMIIPESADQHEGLNDARTAAVVTLNAEIPDSAIFIENNDMKGNNWPGYPFSLEWGYHFNARAENYLEIGWRIGIAALDSGYVLEGPLHLRYPAATNVTFSQAQVAAEINDDADVVTVVWDTVDHGKDSTGDWPNSKGIGPWSGGAGQVSTTLTGLSENTAHVFRFFASSTALSAEAWSPLGSFTTLYEFPPPLLGFPQHTSPAADGATASCELSRAAADSCHLVWAYDDQGEVDPATWAGAPGGGSADLGAASVSDVLEHTITGLDERTEYFYRFVAANTHGTNWSPAGSFTTARAGAPFELTAFYDFEGTGDDRFDDPAGFFADDLSGRHNASFSMDVPANAKDSAQSASFDGNTALFTDAYTTDLGPDPDAYTIMFWIKGDDALQENNNTRLMTSRILPSGSGSSAGRWQVEGFGQAGHGNGMDVRLQSGDLPAIWFQPDAIGALSSGTAPSWHHVTYVLSNSDHPDNDGAYGRTLVDGVQVGSTLDPNSGFDGLNIGNQDGQLIIGGAAENAGNRAFTGLLDDVALFAGVVPDADIAAIAAGTKSPADFLVTAGITITSVEIVGGNLVVGFSGSASTDYKLTVSPDLTSGFADASPAVETTTDGSGNGSLSWPLSGSRGFARVETK